MGIRFSAITQPFLRYPVQIFYGNSRDHYLTIVHLKWHPSHFLEKVAIMGDFWAPLGLWTPNPAKNLAHWVYFLGQPLSQNLIFQNIGNIFGGQLFAANPREFARTRANSRGLRRCSPAFRGGFFSEQWRSSRGLRRCSPDYGGVRANSRELGRSSPRTGELLAKNFVRQKSFDNCM